MNRKFQRVERTENRVYMETMAENVFNADAEMTEFLMSRVDEDIMKYIVESCMELDLIHPTMVDMIPADEVTEEDYVTLPDGSVELPMGYAQTMNFDDAAKFSMITLFEHRMMVLLHELAHVVANYKGLETDKNGGHDEVFFEIHAMLNRLVKDMMGV